MHFTRSMTALFFTSGALAGLLAERQSGVTCQTSDGSPITGEITAAINELGGRGGDCPNTNGEASSCTTLLTRDSASIGVCGGVDDDASTLSCSTIAGYANQIQQTCLSNGRAGGTYTVSASKRIILF